MSQEEENLKTIVEYKGLQEAKLKKLQDDLKEAYTDIMLYNDVVIRFYDSTNYQLYLRTK